MLKIYLVIFGLIGASCKTRSTTGGLRGGDDEGGALTGAVTESDSNASDELAPQLWAKLKAKSSDPDSQILFKDGSNPSLEIVDEEFLTVNCSQKAAKTRCAFTTRSWPKLSEGISATIAAAIGAGSAQVTLGKSDKIVCSGATPSCELVGFSAESITNLEKPKPNPAHKLPKPIVVENGAIDEVTGKPLPQSSAAYVTELSAGGVTLANYTASATELSNYWQTINESTRNSFSKEWDEELSRKIRGCRKEEAFSLRDYADAGFKDMNAVLRQIKDGKIIGQPLNSASDNQIRVTASAIHCLSKSHAEIVFRGANLSAEKLARYQVGRTVVERAFTSTSPNGVLAAFAGNVEFRIWDATGPVLGDLNPQREESEMLIQAGTLFKVVFRTVVNGQTIIEMQQIP